MKISTGTKALDALFDGGLSSSVITVLFGIPNLGKTWFCYQMACMCTRPTSKGGTGKKALYLDTEGFFFTPETVKRFAEYFKKRWPDCDPGKVEVMQIPDIFTLGDQFGMQFKLKQEESRVTAIVHYPTDLQKKLAATKGKPKVESSDKDKDWFSKSPLWKKISTGEYGLLIVDSVTIPIKSEIPTATQNFPARTSLVSALLGACFPIAQRQDIAILITDHITRNPMSPGYQWGVGDPWGGQNVLYYVKHLYGLYMPLKDLIQKYAPDGERIRRIQRYRYPGLDKAIVPVMLGKDEGYKDLPDPEAARPATGDNIGG